MKDKFESFLKTIPEDYGSVNIITHASPDPDAVGSALGAQYLLSHMGINSSIYYSGEISHPQNRTMMNVLGISLNKQDGSTKMDGINVCVDCTESNSIASNPLLVIDHHKGSSKAKYQIIDASYGACSTIVWQLLKELTPIDQDHSNVYTALLLGIRTDTNDLISENMTKEDFRAYQELLELADKDALNKSMNYPLPRYLYEKRLALHLEDNSFENNGVFVGGIGYIPSEQRDVIAILAEEYTRMESVQTAVVFAITDKKMLEVSVRTHLVSLDVNMMMRDLFGQFGGGKSNSGGAQIPLNFYEQVDDKHAAAFWKITCKHMFRKILKDNWNQKEEDN